MKATRVTALWTATGVATIGLAAAAQADNVIYQFQAPPGNIACIMGNSNGGNAFASCQINDHHHRRATAPVGVRYSGSTKATPHTWDAKAIRSFIPHPRRSIGRKRSRSARFPVKTRWGIRHNPYQRARFAGTTAPVTTSASEPIATTWVDDGLRVLPAACARSASGRRRLGEVVDRHVAYILRDEIRGHPSGDLVSSWSKLRPRCERPKRLAAGGAIRPPSAAIGP